MFDKSTWIRLPRNVVVGHGVLDDTVAAVEDLHLAGDPLVVTSPTPAKVAGNHVVESFAAAGFDPQVVRIEEATFGAVEDVIETAGGTPDTANVEQASRSWTPNSTSLSGY